MLAHQRDMDVRYFWFEVGGAVIASIIAITAVATGVVLAVTGHITEAIVVLGPTGALTGAAAGRNVLQLRQSKRGFASGEPETNAA